ncbi:MAG: hypothetical protein AAB914_01825 [Patescibacteria group bacterium]
MSSVIPASSQKIELEGDFYKHFDVYVPKNYERDMLYFVTPELMSILADKGFDYDVEVLDDELYIYKDTFFDFNNNEEIENIFMIIESVGGEFSDNVRLYADERVANRSSNVVAQQGRRLKRRYVSRISLIISILYIFIVLLFVYAHITA